MYVKSQPGRYPQSKNKKTITKARIAPVDNSLPLGHPSKELVYVISQRQLDGIKADRLKNMPGNNEKEKIVNYLNLVHGKFPSEVCFIQKKDDEGKLLTDSNGNPDMYFSSTPLKVITDYIVRA